MRVNWQQVEVELRETLEFLIIPFIGACLPYSLGLRFFKLLARLPWIYRAGVRDGFDNATQLGLTDGVTFREWSIRTKVSQMVDHADVFYLWTRGKRYFSRYVKHNFDAIDWSQVDVIFFPHFGTGGWLYYFLAQQPRRNKLLVHSLPRSTWLPRNWARTTLYRLREKVFAQRLCTDFMSPGDLLRVRKVLQNKEIILISADMPAHQKLKCYQSETPLGKLNVAASFFDLSVRRQCHVALVILGFDYASGRRAFYAEMATNAERAAEQFALLTATAVRERPWLWRMMPLAKEVLVQKSSSLGNTR